MGSRMRPPMANIPPVDLFGRPLRNLRISVTDRCNLRCSYCMPEEEYIWLPREQLLSFEELRDLAGIFTALGVDRIRLTGGEPLLRKDLPVLLAEQAQALRDAGLHRITVSLDTLDRERFKSLTRRDAHAQVLEGIAAARRAGFHGLKLDTVVMRGANELELADLVEYGKRVGAEVRFIEYMDVGGATRWSMNKVFSGAEIMNALRRRYGRIEPVMEDSSAPAERFQLPDGTVFGII